MVDSTPQVYGFPLRDARVLAGIARSVPLQPRPVVGGGGEFGDANKYLCYPAKIKTEVTARDDDTDTPNMIPGEGKVVLYTLEQQSDGTQRFEVYKHYGYEIERDVFNFQKCVYAVDTYVWVAYDSFGKLWVIPLEDTTSIITFKLTTTLSKSTQIAKATIFEQEGPGIPSTFTGAGAIQVHNLPRNDGGYEYKGAIGAYGRAALIAENRYKILSLQCPTKAGWCCCASSSSSRPSRSSSSVSYNCNPSICYGQECAYVWSNYEHDWILWFGCNYGCDCVKPTRHGAYDGEPVVLCCTPGSSSSVSLSSYSYECPEYCNYEYCYWAWDAIVEVWDKVVGCSNPTCYCVEPTDPGEWDGQIDVTCCHVAPSSSLSSSSSSSVSPSSSSSANPSCPPGICNHAMCNYRWDAMTETWDLDGNDCAGAYCGCPVPVDPGEYDGQYLWLCCGSASSSSISVPSSSSSVSSEGSWSSWSSSSSSESFWSSSSWSSSSSDSWSSSSVSLPSLSSSSWSSSSFELPSLSTSSWWSPSSSSPSFDWSSLGG